jgi:hypothetical protein
MQKCDYRSCYLVIMNAKLFKLEDFDYLDLFNKLAERVEDRQSSIDLLKHFPHLQACSITKFST